MNFSLFPDRPSDIAEYREKQPLIPNPSPGGGRNVCPPLSLTGLDFTKGSRTVITTHSRRVYTTNDRPVFTIFHLGEKYCEKISSKERMGEEQTKWSGYI